MRCSLCSHEDRSAIEEACDSSTVARVADQFGVSERALAKHVASHPRLKAKPKPKSAVASQLIAARSRARVISRAAKVDAPAAPPPATVPPADEDLDDDELDDESTPATSRSPIPAPTARAALDEILLEIRTLMKSVNEEDVPFADKAAAIRAALQATRLLANLTGELGASESAIVSSPHWRRLEMELLEILRSHSGALKDVVGWLEKKREAA